MKRLVLRAAIGALAVLSLAEWAAAQLPPTINRIGAVDSAVDPTPFFSDDFVVDSFSPAFGRAILPRTTSFVIPSAPEFNEKPLTVEFWVQLSAPDAFQIFVAHEAKSSPRHWEIYSFAGDGALALYVPGNPSGDTLRSPQTLADGKPHFVGVTMADVAKLFIDGVCVAEMKLDRAHSDATADAKFAVGSLAEGGLFCNALLDDLRISRTIREFSPQTVPSAPLATDDATLFLTHFEFEGDDSLETNRAEMARLLEATVPDQEALKVERFAATPKYLQANRDADAPDQILSFAELGLDAVGRPARTAVEGALAERYGGAIETSAGASLDHLFPSGGLEIDVKPGEKPAKNIPIQAADLARFDARLAEIGVQAFSSGDFRPGVFANWGENYVDLAAQLAGEKTHPRGAAEQVLDENSLVFPDKEK
ncbi:MAG: LamG domain-containing protein, partial [Thermoguttaceae bacterium]|nr:LamG domain-containing protein [Thermoguttaceae bacterium]